MSEVYDNQPSVFQVYEEVETGLDIRAAFAAANRLERFANIKELSVSQTQSLANELDSSELWATHYMKEMSVVGFLHKVHLVQTAEGRPATAIEATPVYCDEGMLSHGFYVSNEALYVDDEPVAKSLKVGLYFVDIQNQHYFGQLGDIEVVPIDNRHLATERLRRHFPDDLSALDQGIGEHDNEEGFVAQTMQWVAIDVTTHADLKQRYISDLEDYINLKVEFDQELPYLLQMSGDCTRLHSDGSEVAVKVEDYRAYVKPERIRVTAIPSDPENYRFELEYSEHSAQQNGAKVRFRAEGASIQKLLSLRRHGQDTPSSL